jgi:cob(I)alamin adenosyltransferase
MAKTQVQLNREHIARIRRKARAFDKLAQELKTIIVECMPDIYAKGAVERAIERAERQAEK